MTEPHMSVQLVGGLLVAVYMADGPALLGVPIERRTLPSEFRVAVSFPSSL